MNTGNWIRTNDLGVMSPARSPLRHPGCVAVETACAASDKAANDKYRQQASILCPQGYEPCALPLRHTG